MLDSFEQTYAEYKRLFAKIDEAEGISGKNEIFRQLTALLSKMENGIDEDDFERDSSNSTSFLHEMAGMM